MMMLWRMMLMTIVMMLGLNGSKAMTVRMLTGDQLRSCEDCLRNATSLHRWIIKPREEVECLTVTYNRTLLLAYHHVQHFSDCQREYIWQIYSIREIRRSQPVGEVWRTTVEARRKAERQEYRDSLMGSRKGPFEPKQEELVNYEEILELRRAIADRTVMTPMLPDRYYTYPEAIPGISFFLWFLPFF